jgi:Conserved hypothetical protein (DUF2461)
VRLVTYIYDFGRKKNGLLGKACGLRFWPTWIIEWAFVWLLTFGCSTVHDADYRTSWKDWESFVESLTEKIVDKDDTIPELPPKDLVRRLRVCPPAKWLALIRFFQVFRIYRDVRFSPDPTPYKV